MGILFDRERNEDLRFKFKSEEEDINKIILGIVLGREVHFDNGKIIFIEGKTPDLATWGTTLTSTRTNVLGVMKRWIDSELNKENELFTINYASLNNDIVDYHNFRGIFEIVYKIDINEETKNFLKNKIKGYISSVIGSVGWIEQEDKEGILVEYSQINIEDFKGEINAMINERVLLEKFKDIDKSMEIKNKVKI